MQIVNGANVLFDVKITFMSHPELLGELKQKYK